MNNRTPRNLAILGVLALAAGGVAQSALAPAFSPGAQLRADQNALEAGDAAKALADVQANLDRYDSTDMPVALLISGRAKTALADKATEPAARTKLLLQGALDFMRVATFYPYCEQADEAMFRAGKALAAAGDAASARAAYQALIARHSQGDWTAKAQMELKARNSQGDAK